MHSLSLRDIFPYMRKAIAVFALLAALLGLNAAGVPEYTPLLTVQPSHLEADKAASQSRSISQILYSLGNLYSYLDNNFLYDIDTESMETDLISAMIDSLGDQYSYYITPDNAMTFEENTEGEYIGIGTYLTKMNPAYADPEDPESWMVIIASPFPGGPADRAGLRPRDMISAINGESVASMTATEASDMMKGHIGDDITLTVHRGTAVFDITLQPEIVTTPSTVSGMLTDEIGYIAIYTFSLTTGESVTHDIEKLLSEGAEKLIIDLRNNGGGTVQSALETADLFLSGGEMMETKYKPASGRSESVIYADPEILVPETMPLLLIVNGGTASSSEILTGALKDNGRATVLGSQTFGKGISQEIRPYRGGFVQITTGHFYTPTGNDIHEVGITPDILVEEKEYTDEEMEAFETFMEEDRFTSYIESHPGYTKENIENFADENTESGVPEDLLKILIRNEYLYAMDYDERPVADIWFDPYITAALEAMNESIPSQT